MELERIENVKNSVGKGFGPGRSVPIAMSTDSNKVYRVTGMDQIEDIVECGYVRPKGYGSRRDGVGDKIYWSQGGSNLYYYDKRPVLESTIEKVKDGQLGAISIDDLTAIWIFDKKENKYVNNLENIKYLYRGMHPDIEEEKGKTRR